VQLSFRAKLTLIIGTTALGFILMLVGGAWSSVQQNSQLDIVEGRLVPKLELGPRLSSSFEHLRQSLQDAVAAEDLAALDATRQLKNELLGVIAAAEQVIPVSESVSLRHAVNDYYTVAFDVSRRLIRGEGGEGIVDAMSDMRARHLEAARMVERSSGLDRGELTRGFEAVRAANRRMLFNIMSIASACFAVVLILALWVSRSALRMVSDLSGGFARFAHEDFSHPIPVHSGDELGEATHAANRMASALEKLASDRDHAAWIRAGIDELSEKLRGDPSPAVAAAISIEALCKKMGGGIGLFYLSDPSGRLSLAGHYGLGDVAARELEGAGFRPGEGLVGQACLGDELLIIDAPPADYFRIRSGLGEILPQTIVFVPLHWRSRLVGIVEIGLFGACSHRCRELLAGVRELLAVRLDALYARQLERELLTRTQDLAERLTVQEEELRASNMELSVQQEELRETNALLTAQSGTLAQQNAELEQMRRGLEEKARELEKVSTYKSQFLANMSHELRTPLNSMLLLSHLLSENESGNLSEKQVEFCRTIHSAGKDLLSLINQVLDLAKVESGRQEVSLERVGLAELGAHLQRTFEAMALDKGLWLTVDVAPALPAAIVTDRQRVERILINLIGNAIKFTSHGGVALTIGRPAPGAFGERDGAPEGWVAFAVTDTGIGIAPADHERVFAPFEQVEARADRRYGGSGLGLAIARESAQLLGGELVLASERGRGSTFTLHLPELPVGHSRPMLAVPDRAGDGAGDSRVADDRLGIELDEPYLLLIEDDRTFAELVVDIIHARHFKVVVAGTGADALRMARKNRPIGIVLDVKLPDMSGFTVMEQLRHDARTRNIPVHFISGVDAPERALALGAIGYLTKPATRSELIGVVRSLERPSSDGSSKILLVEDDRIEGQSLMSVLAREGLPASLASSAEAALIELSQQHFGCMILDLGLPDTDGLGLLEAIHARPELSRPPVVVHTARSLTKEETRRIEAYAKAIVLKDGSSQERLLHEVKRFAHEVSAALPEKHSDPGDMPDVGGSLGGKKILLAEDDMRTVYALSALLRAKGAEVVVAETGREALELLAQHRDVQGVLMDIMMPEMDGYEAMRELRAQDRFRDLPVIALTARAMKGEREKCLEVGASDYLSKPVDPAQLLAKLDIWLSPGETRAN
jgi:CheY-like chemotaxis protein